MTPEQTQQDLLDYMQKYHETLKELQKLHVKFAVLIRKYEELEKYAELWKAKTEELIETIEYIKAINCRTN